MAKLNSKNHAGQNLPGVTEMRAWRAAPTDTLIMAGMGAGIGNFVAGTLAGLMLNSPAWFGDPFLPASTFGIPIYSLTPVILTALKYSSQPGAMTAVYAAAASMAACVIPLALLGQSKARKARDKIMKSDIHGSAHFADRNEIKAASLLPPAAEDKKADRRHTCYVGGWVDEKTGKQIYLQHTGPEHIIVHAPTRSGKGVGLVIPTLLSWRGSVLVNDIKGENHALTAGWRASIGQRILRFSPTEPENSCRFNPLAEIRIGKNREVSDVQNIASMIVDPDGKGLVDHWQKTGFALLVSAILHILYCRDYKLKTLRAVGSLLSNPDLDPEEGVDQIFTVMKQYDHDPSGKMGWTDHNGKPTKTHPVIAESAQEMINKAANEKSGVISTMMSFLSLYRDPLVADVISKSDFAITDLMRADKPISLYLVVPPSDKDRLKPLIRLILNQVVRRLTEEMEFEGGRSVAKYKHRLLLMIDEFPSLGKLDVFEEALAFIAGYGLKAYLICQDTAQLHKAYTQNESITSNCHVRIFYAPNRIETAEYVSKMLGKQTLTTESHNISYAGGGLMPYQTGSSGGIQHQGRELMTADEIMRLRGPAKDKDGNITKPGAMIVSVAGHAPVLGTQILYFRDPVFDRRSRMPAPSTAIPGAVSSDQPPSPPVAVPVAAKPEQISIPVEQPIAVPSPETDSESIEIDEADIAEALASGLAPDVDVDVDDGLPDFELDQPAPAAPDVGVEDVEDVLRTAAADAAKILRGRQAYADISLSRETFKPSDESTHRARDKESFSRLI